MLSQKSLIALELDDKITEIAQGGKLRSFIKPNRNLYLLLLEIDLDSLIPLESPLRYIDQLVELSPDLR